MGLAAPAHPDEIGSGKLTPGGGIIPHTADGTLGLEYQAGVAPGPRNVLSANLSDAPPGACSVAHRERGRRFLGGALTRYLTKYFSLHFPVTLLQRDCIDCHGDRLGKTKAS